MAGNRSQGISESYISPMARWAMFKEEHPLAPPPEFDICTPNDVGIPVEFMEGAADDLVCIATLDPADGSPVIIGWHEIPATEVYYENNQRKTRPFRRTPEAWKKLTTMTLGRALQLAGFPMDSKDLQLVILFRRRMAELELISGGSLPAALGPGDGGDDPDAPVFEAASTPAEEGVTDDLDHAPPAGVDDEPVDAQLLEDPPAEELLLEMRKAIGSLNRAGQDKVRRWARDEQGMPWPITEKSTIAQAEAVFVYAVSLAEPPAEAEAPQYAPGEEPFGEAGQ